MIEINAKLQRGHFQLEAELALPEGVTGLFGPSGSGKSTLLGIISGLIAPQFGKIRIHDQTLFDSSQGINLPPQARQIGMVFQESRLFPHLNVHHNLRYGYKLLPKDKQRLQPDQIIALLELEPLLGQKPSQLSGGEKQRVALGRALLSSPRFLLLDEPLASLDTRLKDQILPFLKRVAKETHVPMLYVSHAINEVLYLTSNVAMINQGKIVAHGAFHSIIQQGTAARLATSLGLENILKVTVYSHSPELGYSLVRHENQILFAPLLNIPIGSEVHIAIPAHAIALSLAKMDGITIQNQFPGKVEKIELLTHKAIVQIDMGVLISVEVTTKAIQDLQLKVGSKAYCLFKTQSIEILN